MGINILNHFYNKNCNSPQPFSIEKSFKFPYRGFILTGKCDKVDKVDGKIQITDYKTNYDVPLPVELEYNYQFTFYHIAFERLQQKVDELIYYHLKDNKLLPTKRGQGHIEELLGELYLANDGVKNGQFEPFRGFHCRWCDYPEECNKEGYDNTLYKKYFSMNCATTSKR